jgi:hypothetical protein
LQVLIRDHLEDVASHQPQVTRVSRTADSNAKAIGLDAGAVAQYLPRPVPKLGELQASTIRLSTTQRLSLVTGHARAGAGMSPAVEYCKDQHLVSFSELRSEQ